MRRNGGGPQINRQPIKRAVIISGPDLHDPVRIFLVSPMHGKGHLPAPLAQDRLHPLQDAEIRRDVFKPPLIVQRRLQALKIPGWIVHVRLGHLNIIKLGGGVQNNIAGLGALAHDLLVHLAFGRHVNDHVPLNSGLTP